MTQFVPRYEGHEPPLHFADIRVPQLCHLDIPVLRATPRPMTSKELRAKTARDARISRANERKAACKHPTLTRVYGNDCAVRCAACKVVIPVADKAERNRLCPKAPGQVTARYEINGEFMTVYELAGRFGIDWRTIYKRLSAGSTVQESVSPTNRMMRKAHA